MLIKNIIVGKRFRKDLGDLETLKRSIQEIGLLQPIVVDENNNLIAGLRRLRAFEELDKKDIPVRIINEIIYNNFIKIKERLEKKIKNPKQFCFDLIDNINIEKAIGKKAKEVCNVCFWSFTSIAIEKHHFLHKKENGTDKLINRIFLCPNCHSIIHWFEREYFKNIDAYFNDFNSPEEIKKEIKSIIMESMGKEGFDKREIQVQRLTDLLLAKLIYILFIYETI